MQVWAVQKGIYHLHPCQPKHPFLLQASYGVSISPDFFCKKKPPNGLCLLGQKSRRRLTMKCLTCTTRRQTDREPLLGLQEVPMQPWPRLLLTDTGQAALKAQGLIRLGGPEDKHCLLSRRSHARTNTELEASPSKLTTSQPSGESAHPLPAVGKRHHCHTPLVQGLLQEKRGQLKRQLQHKQCLRAAVFRKGFWKYLLSPPSFLHRTDALHLLKRLHSGNGPFPGHRPHSHRSFRSLMLQQALASISSCFSPEGLCLDRAAISQSFPPSTCIAAEHDKPPTQGLPLALFLRETVVTHRQDSLSPLTGPPSPANLFCNHTTCRALHKALMYKHNARPFIHMLHPFSPI